MQILDNKILKKLEHEKKEYIRGSILLALKFSESKELQKFYRDQKHKAEVEWDKIYSINYKKMEEQNKYKAKGSKEHERTNGYNSITDSN